MATGTNESGGGSSPFSPLTPLPYVLRQGKSPGQEKLRSEQLGVVLEVAVLLRVRLIIVRCR